MADVKRRVASGSRDDRLPPTERSNSLTQELHTLSSEEMVSVFQKVDGELFQKEISAALQKTVSEMWYTAQHPTIWKTIEKLSRIIYDGLKGNQENKKKSMGIVFSGCGTSGRIAFLCARSCNQVLEKMDMTPCFHYLIAGGDASIVMSQELPEDSAYEGMTDLEDILCNHDQWIVIGITCGLSAPYVFGQLAYALANEDRCFHAIGLIGFNPPSFARNVSVEHWNRTCQAVVMDLYQVAQIQSSSIAEKSETSSASGKNARLKKTSAYPVNEHTPLVFILNPSIGAEAVTGSSRMKGGSMAFILLHCLCAPVLQALLASSTHADEAPSQETLKIKDLPALFDKKEASMLEYIDLMMHTFEKTYQETYTQMISVLPAVIQAAGKSLCQNQGHIYYVGDDAVGLMGMIDASEMYDTYGLPFLKVRGFLNGGWSAARIVSGDLADRGELFCVGARHFAARIVFTLTPQDTVIFSCEDTPVLHPKMCALASATRKRGSQTFIFCFTSKEKKVLDPEWPPSLKDQIDQDLLQETHYIRLSTTHAIPYLNSYTQFAAKLIYNIITTGAAVCKGLVFSNLMVNLNVSNNKLYFRSLRILQQCGAPSSKDATIALLRAIYECDQVSEEMMEKSISSHILIATPKPFVLPLALRLVKKKHETVSQIKKELEIAGIISS